MSVRIDHLFSPALDGNGDPLSGAKLYVDLAGTTTNVTTYSDAALTTANADPVVADSEGRFPAIFAPGGLYKVTITTSADASVTVRDNLSLFGRLYDRLNVGASDTTNYGGIGVDGNFVLLDPDGLFTANIYYNGSYLFGGDGYGAYLQLQDGSGDVNLLISTSQNASGAGASASFAQIYEFNRAQDRHIFSDQSGNELLILDALVECEPIYDNTTASAANVYVATASESRGALYRSTSSLKYKRDVEPMTLESAYTALDAEAIFYRSKCARDNQAWSYYGFGAEQVAKVDPRLVHWGEDGPEGVQYERFVPHLVEICRDQRKRIEALEAAAFNDAPDAMGLQKRIADLEAKLATFDDLEDFDEQPSG